MASSDFADGGVHSLTMGSSELSSILASAASRRQLVLVDYSASWCGPCRMMEPVLRNLAGQHRGRLAVVKVDCEATAANQDLARDAGIRAFPTFHLHRASRKVAELRGADPHGLEAVIRQELAALGGGGGSGPAGGAMAQTLAAALARVKAGCSFDEFIAAAKVLLHFVGNILEHPGEAKYTRVRASNASFVRQLGSKPGGRECMRALGFNEIMEAGEAVFVMGEVPPELGAVKSLLQQAVAQGEAAAAATARAAAPAPAVPAPAAQQQAAGTGAVAAAPAPTVASAGPALDSAALARALTAATAAASGGSAAPPAAPGPAAGRQQRPRVLRVTPAKLARALEQMMIRAGIGQPGEQQGRQQEHQREQQPPAPGA